MCALTSPVFAQVGAGSKVTRNETATRDSLARISYPYVFPLYAERTLKKGFKVPYPIGVMLNGVAVRQNVDISDLMVGINALEPVALDFVKFGQVTAHVQDINVRVDLWLFPFLNIYGILGNAWAKTNVEVVSPVSFTTTADFSGIVYGAGAMLAGGVNRFFITLDYNTTWSSFKNMNHSVNTMILSPRLGYSIPLGKEEMNIGLWLGTSYLFIDGNTSGVYALSNLRGSIPKDKVDAIIAETEAWYQGLKPAQQAIVKGIAEEIKTFNENHDVKDAEINYSLTKKPQSNWTLLIGAQFQLDRHWQFRTEAGLLGGRTSGLFSVNYRFGL